MNFPRRVIIIIPARSGSKRLLNKNVLEIDHKPLFYYSVKAAQEANISPDIYVLSDSEEILQLAKEFGAIPFLLPPELAGDTTEVVKPSIYALEKLKEENLEFDDFICLQPTSPLRNAEDIKQSYQKYLVAKADSLVSVAEVDPHYFHWAVQENESQDFGQLYFGSKFLKSRSELPTIYWPNGAVKIARIEVIKKQGHFFGERMAIYKMPSERSIHIATKFEFNLCKSLIENASPR